MKTFKLLRLPSLAFEQVIKKLDTAKIIELTILSTRFKRKVQEFKLKVPTLTWEYSHSIEIISPGGSVRIKSSLRNDWEIGKVNGASVRMASDYSNPHQPLLFVNTACRSSTCCNRLELMHSDWATPGCLNSDHYTHIQIHAFPNVQHCFLNEVLKNWMKGGHEKLERFYVSTSPLSWNMRSMLDGIEQMPINFSRFELQLHSMYWYTKIDCVDIRRPIDGRLATVQMSDVCFLLLVWHEKHFKYVSKETKTKLRKLKLIKE
ncbi:unnamed protein product [Caenorhabditis brenneri]